MNTIRFSKRDDQTAWVAPAAFLQGAFDQFRDILQAGAAVYSEKEKKSWIELHRARNLGRLLKKGGFHLALSQDFIDLMAAYDARVAAEKQSRGSRLHEVKARLLTRAQFLYPYQEEGIERLADMPACLLADPPGLGKTLQLLLAAPDTSPILVVCPAIAKGVWEVETAKWRPDLKVTTFSGRGSFRWPEPGELCIINYELLPPTKKEYIELADLLEAHMMQFCEYEAKIEEVKQRKPDFDDVKFRAENKDYQKTCDTITKLWNRGESYVNWMLPDHFKAPTMTLIFDEAHALKTGTAQRTKRARNLAKQVREKNGRAWAATGTPILNKPTELWTILNVIGAAELAFGSWPRFCRLFGGTEGQFGGMEWGLPDPSVRSCLDKVMIRRERRDVLPQLPVKTWSTLRVATDRKITALCNAAMEVIKAKGLNLDDLDAIVRATSQQSADFEVLSQARQALSTMKTSAAMDFIETLEEANEKVILFSSFLPPVETFAKREGWTTITGATSDADRARIVKEFQEGKYKGIAITIKAGATALTLTAARYVVFIDRDWTPAMNEQAEDRALRIGQTRGVQIITLVADHALDYRVYEVLRRKQELVNRTLLGR